MRKKERIKADIEKIEKNIKFVSTQIDTAPMYPSNSSRNDTRTINALEKTLKDLYTELRELEQELAALV